MRPHRPAPDYLRIVREERLHFVEDSPPKPLATHRTWRLFRGALLALALTFAGAVALGLWVVRR